MKDCEQVPPEIQPASGRDVEEMTSSCPSLLC